MNILVKTPPRLWYQGDAVTVQVGYHDEDGEFVVDVCNHAGAQVEDVTFLSDPENTHEELVCDKCGKSRGLEEGAEWR